MDKEVFMKNKKKIIIVVAAIAVSLIGFSLLNSTYSLFYHEETSKNTEGYSTGTLSITASSKGSTISLSDALPVEEWRQKTSLVKITYVILFILVISLILNYCLLVVVVLLLVHNILN